MLRNDSSGVAYPPRQIRGPSDVVARVGERIRDRAGRGRRGSLLGFPSLWPIHDDADQSSDLSIFRTFHSRARGVIVAPSARKKDRNRAIDGGIRLSRENGTIGIAWREQCGKDPTSPVDLFAMPRLEQPLSRRGSSMCVRVS